MKELRRNRREAQRCKTIGHIADMGIHSENFGEHHNAAFGFLAGRLGEPGQHRRAIIDFDFDMF